MVDRHALSFLHPLLHRLAQALAARGVSANAVTWLGFALGLGAAGAIALQAYAVALALIALSRLCDGIDGAVARLTQPTDRGAFLDIALDFIFYASIPLAFALADPARNALPAAVLLAAFVGTGSTFLAFSVMAERRGLKSEAYPSKGLFYLGGLTEATETLACFALMCLWPGAFGALAYGFAALCALTVCMRLAAGWKALGSVAAVALSMAVWMGPAAPAWAAGTAGSVLPSAQASGLLAPLGDPAWTAARLPAQKLPPTRFEPVEAEGRPAVRVVAEGSYGNLVHAVAPAAAASRTLVWRWRLDQPLAGADLLKKPGDDAAVKVCALFDLPIDKVPFVERQMLRVARAASGQSLPAATLCYVWAPLATAGQVIPNAHTKRMRWMVLQGQGSPLAAWRTEQRDLRADFLRAFGDETAEVPPLVAVLVGADADNTGSSSVAFIADLVLRP